MTEEFEYERIGKGACVTKILAPGAVVVIPDELGGEPVTELADRLFAGAAVTEVFLPRDLVKIGRYAFYNCEKLTAVHFYGAVREVGGGLFNGCGKISELFVCADGDGRSALKDFVNEISGRLTVHYFPENGEPEGARLVFPVYYDEAVENTPARNISSSIHGCGHRYRYCFEDMKLQFERYDRQFSYEVIEEGVLSAAELALNRLRYSHGLSGGARRAYGEFVGAHRREILSRAIGEPELFKWLVREIERPDREIPGLGGGLSEGELSALTKAAGDRRQAELMSLLMDLRHEKCKPGRRKFTL